MREVFYEAAGGVVVHEDKVLLLDRPSRNELRLPKGHIEKGESPEESALREVCEESGYSGLDIVADLGKRRVQFDDPYKRRRVTRDERYFLMRLVDEQREQRDEKERQFTVTWVSFDEAVRRLTFESEQEFVRHAMRWVEENGLPTAG